MGPNPKVAHGLHPLGGKGFSSSFTLLSIIVYKTTFLYSILVEPIMPDEFEIRYPKCIRAKQFDIKIIDKFL